MDAIEMNRKATAVLKEWDPFRKGKDAYTQEIAEVLEALDQFDHPVDLANSIREIYERSFMIWIPIEKCMHIAYKLLAIKYEALSIV